MAVKPDTWMPMYWGDYLQDTGHLSTAEHGAYMLLIGHYWSTGPLPNADAKLARLTRCSPQEWAAIRETISEFFTEKDGRWHHARIDKEIQLAKTNIEKRSQAGRKAAAKRWHSDGTTDAIRDDCPTPTPTPVEEKGSLSGAQKEPEPEILPPKKPNGSGKRGARLPDDWAPDDELIGWCLREGADLMLVEREAEKFRDYWRAKPGAGGVKLDWDATFRNWMRKALDDQGGKRPRLDGFAAVAAELEGER